MMICMNCRWFFRKYGVVESVAGDLTIGGVEMAGFWKLECGEPPLGVSVQMWSLSISGGNPNVYLGTK